MSYRRGTLGQVEEAPDAGDALLRWLVVGLVGLSISRLWRR